MIKKLILICMLGTASVGAAMFEESPAYAHASPLFKTNYSYLCDLEPVEILLPRNSMEFNRVWVESLSVYFHNMVTPLLDLKAIDYLNTDVNHDATLDIDRGAIEIYLRDERTKLMADCIRNAYTVTMAHRDKNPDHPDFNKESPLFGSLLKLRHYNEGIVSEGRIVVENVIAQVIPDDITLFTYANYVEYANREGNNLEP